MNDEKLAALYEKLYFVETEARDKIVARLQLPLTLLIAIAGALVFLLQNYDTKSGQWRSDHWMFWLFMTGACISLGLAIDRFIRALHNNEYYFLPNTREIAAYRALLQSTYEPYPNCVDLIDKAMGTFITQRMADDAAFNTVTNDRRSLFIHQCTEAIIGAVILLVASYATFFIGDLDRSKLPPTEIRLKQPVDIRMVK